MAELFLGIIAAAACLTYFEAIKIRSFVEVIIANMADVINKDED